MYRRSNLLWSRAKVGAERPAYPLKKCPLWAFTENTLLRIYQVPSKHIVAQKRGGIKIENAIFPLLSGHRWKRTACGLLSFGFFKTTIGKIDIDPTVGQKS